MVGRLKANEAAICTGVAPTLSIESGSRKGAVAGFCVSRGGAEPSAEEAVRLMLVLIDRTLPHLTSSSAGDKAGATLEVR